MKVLWKRNLTIRIYILIVRWQKRYFQLKNGFLFWYKDKVSREAQNNIPVSDMIKIESHKENKFLIVCKDKVYKFSNETEVMKSNWISALNEDIKKRKGEKSKRIENSLEIKLKKKVITDFYKLPNIETDKLSLKNRIDEDIKQDQSFQFKNKQ